MRSSLLDYAFSVLAFYKTVAGLRVKNSCLQQLYFNKIMKQLLHLVFMFTAAASLFFC